MSKVFSIIGLETNTGIRDIGLMSGIPEVEDIQKSQLYKELVEDCGESEFITVAVKSFSYGEGEPEDAMAEDLDWLKSHPEFLKSEAVTHLKTNNFAILYPDQGMQMNM
ncbi:hypothetical protein Dtox_1473 [Desulfofarcimen acetoxidans DSM 771]|uniref:Uncharacterized protein n=1 Tax=Desulfofarcimen acetoxidans (strain ATCC 49208 / DSM 771 / KCTC 5769 / VKM B-1644 / 5575) TaxID=485916 RepID=C8VVM2_DESAS|nr:hypothetical protein [Desulfofarcimen acetoxidans]ACV62337.1 hypothetical protein Dtox_1473 [Desulfofarcimen acetoxidans DSM 771]